MPLTDHVTDVQLNEYLDNETRPEERAQIEAHLSACEDCAARVTALNTLFAEIESLPELELSKPLATPFTRPTSLPVPQMPRWLTLTATLQAACALVVLFFAAPFMTNLLPSIETLSLTPMLLHLQSQWTAWLDLLSSFHLPSMPQLPALEISSLMLTLTLTSVSLLWLVGNGLLLRQQSK